MRDTSVDIFVRHHVDLKLNAITHFQVQNELMLVALNGQNLFHIRLQNSRQTNLKMPIELHDRIAHLHLDFSGAHGLVSTVAGENFHVNMRNGALKPLRRLKGHVVSSVAWNSEFSKESETGFMVVGTTKGSIYETNITSSGAMNYFKQLSANFTEKELPISGLHLRQLGEADSEYLLLICTPNRLYCLVGAANMQAASQQPTQQVVGTVWSSVMVESQEAVLQALFNAKAKKPRFLAMNKDRDNEVPPSALAVFPLSSDEVQPKFAWLAAEGLSIGTVDTNKWRKGSSPDGFETLTVDVKINHRRSEGRLDYPLDICLTEYHLLLLYTNRLAAISLLDRTLAFEDFYTGVPKIMGMSRDCSSHLIWVFSESMAFKYRPNDESRNVWRIFLEQKEFGKAKKIANKLRDKRPFQIIIKKEAEKFIAEKNFVAAAESLAQSDEPFEKLVLLMTRDGPSSRNGLKRFLELKMNQLHGSQERMHRDMLVLWLFEIQLAELAELCRSATADETGTGSSSETAETQNQQEAEIRRLKDQLYCFLNRPAVFEAITDNQAAVYRAISSHVDFDVQLYLAQKLHDYQTVIKIQLMQKAYREVLDILARERRPELFYEHAAELIVELPDEFVRLLKQEKGLNPVKLLPALHKCLDPELKNRAKIMEATFAFIEHIPPANAPGALIDFSINLYAIFKPRALLDYLKKCLVNSRRGSQAPFDVGQATRICMEHGMSECRVFLLCVEGLYEEAVKLALTISTDLAKQCAEELDALIDQREQESLADFVMDEKGHELRRGPTSPQMLQMRRRVWLEIAKSMIREGAPISNCLELLEESKNAIRIQDLLELFPEFTKMEQFKQPLLACLKEYSAEIKQYQSETDERSEMADELRQEQEKGRSGFMVVRTSGQCSFCKGTLLQRPFVAFVCRHFFHRDCLETKVKTQSEEYSNLEAEERVLRKELQLATTTTTNLRTKNLQRTRGGRQEVALKKMESIRNRMLELLCGDCPLCGVQTMEAVDEPFFASADVYMEQLKLWMP